jgi:hypothetical protein
MKCGVQFSLMLDWRKLRTNENKCENLHGPTLAGPKEDPNVTNNN